MHSHSAPQILQRPLFRWFALATAVVWLGCGSAVATVRDEAVTGEETAETGGGLPPTATGSDTPAAATSVAPAAETDGLTGAAAPAVDEGGATAPPPADADAPPDPPCAAATQAEFNSLCLDDGCTPLRRRVDDFTIYSCDDLSPWEIWGSHTTPEGITQVGPLMVHDVAAELDTYSVVERQQIEAVELRTVGRERLFFTAVSYVISGEVPDSRGRESLYELSAAVLVSVCRADGVCPIQNALAWRNSVEVNHPYRPSDAALARRGLEWRSAVAVEGTRVTVTHRYRNVGYRIPDDVVSVDVADPRTYVDASR